MQTCRTCNEAKDLELYPRNHSYSNGRATKCKACQAKDAGKWRNPTRTAMWKYRLPHEQAEALVTETSCHLCGGPQRPGKTMCVDHCHTTGKVRGALCDMCNKGLGQFRDNPELMRKAANYVELHSSAKSN